MMMYETNHLGDEQSEYFLFVSDKNNEGQAGCGLLDDENQ
jgi:hypothetical protein